jgi:hypothetical protein
MTKTLQRSEDLYIQFTPEELTEFGLKEGDKFSWKTENGSIILSKCVDIEIDMTDWPVELLHYLIQKSVEKDVSVNEIIVNILEEQLKNINGKST